MSKYLVFVLAVLTIASCAIGIQCIGNDKTKASNKKFLVYMLIAAIVSLIGSAFAILKSGKKVTGAETTNINIARGNANAGPAGLKQN